MHRPGRSHSAEDATTYDGECQDCTKCCILLLRSIYIFSPDKGTLPLRAIPAVRSTGIPCRGPPRGYRGPIGMTAFGIHTCIHRGPHTNYDMPCAHLCASVVPYEFIRRLPVPCEFIRRPAVCYSPSAFPNTYGRQARISAANGAGRLWPGWASCQFTTSNSGPARSGAHRSRLCDSPVG